MAIYYVRPDGNNTNTGLNPTVGTGSGAWATISKYASVAVAGDTCYIAPGTYREAVAATNSGSAGLPITYYGDRKCEYFPGLTAGDVIISGMNAETDTALTRTQGFSTAVKNYLTLKNLDFENIASSTPSGVIHNGGGTNLVVENCRMIKGIQATGIFSSGASVTVTNCIILTVNYAVCIQANSMLFKNCILKTNSQIDVILSNGAYSVEFDHCVIEGRYTSGQTGSALVLYGCVWSGGSSGAFISLPSNAPINAKGTTFLGRGGHFILNVNTASSFLGCKFKDLEAVSGSNTPATINYCEFENVKLGFQNTSGAAHTLNSCYFKNCGAASTLGGGGGSTTFNSCRFYGNSVINTGALTNNSPTYYEDDIFAGIGISALSPISGSKSLKIKGYDYGTVFTQWIPCEANKPKTVKMKIKRNSIVEGSMIRLGDQVIQMSVNTKTQGDGWLVGSSGSYSGSSIRYSSNKDDYMEFTFNGTGIRLITGKQSNWGIIAISIDGGIETNVDLYNASALYQQTVYEVTGLAPGNHKIKVRVTGTKNASSTAVMCGVDAFEYYNTSAWYRVESTIIYTDTETIDITYTHHKNELVPLFINTRVSTVGGDFVQYDNIG